MPRLHICEHPPHVPRRVCGQETELLCSHCDAPRCADHGMKIDGAFLCLAAVRDANRETIASRPSVCSASERQVARAIIERLSGKGVLESSTNK